MTSAASILMFFMFFVLQAPAPTTRSKVFVVDKVTQVGSATTYGGTAKVQEGEHHTAPVVMSSFSKTCPAITFTQVKEDADYVLQTQSGGTMLSDQKGNVLYVSPAKTLKNMTKDVCKFISTR